jgi:hypothetical protein
MTDNPRRLEASSGWLGRAHLVAGRTFRTPRHREKSWTSPLAIAGTASRAGTPARVGAFTRMPFDLLVDLGSISILAAQDGPAVGGRPIAA